VEAEQRQAVSTSAASAALMPAAAALMPATPLLATAGSPAAVPLTSAAPVLPAAAAALLRRAADPAISMAPTVGGAITTSAWLVANAKSYAPRGFYTARGGELFTSLSHSSLAQTKAR